MKIHPAKHFRTVAAFTMIEVAICLAIIGIALVGIIGVLPRGMSTQRDNREETLIGQDANMLIELIRNGSHGPDDLTNYVFAVTNYWYWQSNAASGQGVSGYDYNNANVSGTPPSPNPYLHVAPINSGSNIISLLSTPEFTDFSGQPIPSFIAGGVSNHIVAYVHSISGLASEKPPQDNQIMRDDSFTYRVLCVNAPMPMDLPPLWQNQVYNQNDKVYWSLKQWQWQPSTNSLAADVPGSTAGWVRSNPFADQLAASQRELRLRFLWPEQPNHTPGNTIQNFRATIGGQLLKTNNFSTGHLLYFYQPQSFTRLP